MRKIYKNGKWCEGAAGPEHLSEDLRKLPADYLTKDAAEGDKIHADDPEHIREALIDELDKHTLGEEKTETKDGIKKLKCAPADKVVRLNQWEIDVVRMRIINALINSHISAIENGRTPDIFAKYYLWFQKNNVNIYELRSGNPPAKRDRPKFLRNYKLHIDIFNWPRHIRDVLKEQGYSVPSQEEIMKRFQLAILNREYFQDEQENLIITPR